MRYLSICSGIEAASIAWHPLGWSAVAVAEIEDFPSAVLRYRFPDVPNLGDMTKFLEWPEELLKQVDLVVGGTPCQAFSIAGLRNSLDDHRGNLTLVFIDLIDHINNVRKKHDLPPVGIVWENVPGVLSTKDNAFGSFLSGLSGADVTSISKWAKAGRVMGPGRRVAWAVLDAQFFGVAQRRRRVFVVAFPAASIGCAGGWPDPAEVLLIGSCLRRDTPARGAKGEILAPDASAGASAGRPSIMCHQDVLTIDARNKVDRGDSQHLDRIVTVVEPVSFYDNDLFLDNIQTQGASVPVKVCSKVAACTPWDGQRARIHDAEGIAPTLPSGSVNSGNVIPAVAITGLVPDVSPSAHLVPVKHKWPAEVASTLNAAYGEKMGLEDQHALGGASLFVPDTLGTITARMFNALGSRDVEHGAVIPVLFQNHLSDSRVTEERETAPTVRSRYGTGGGNVPLVSAAFKATMGAKAKGIGYAEEQAPTLGSDAGNNAVIAFEPGQLKRDGHANRTVVECTPTLRSNMGDNQTAVAFGGDVARTLNPRHDSSPCADRGMDVIATSMQVRRLTPEECERLQGFPRGWTRIPYKGKPADKCPDGPRYKVCGNSMAVPVMRFIGWRIDQLKGAMQ